MVRVAGMQVSLEESYNPQIGLDVFKEDPNFQETEQKYEVSPATETARSDKGLPGLVEPACAIVCMLWPAQEYMCTMTACLPAACSSVLCSSVALEGFAEGHACMQAIKKEILGEDDEGEDEDDDDEEDDGDDDEEDESDEGGAGQAPGATATQRIQVCYWVISPAPATSTSHVSLCHTALSVYVLTAHILQQLEMSSQLMTGLHAPGQHRDKPHQSEADHLPDHHERAHL